MRSLPFLALSVLLAVGSAALAASSLPDLASAWRERDIRIDGVDEDWRDLTQPVKGQHFSVGFVNDAEALYFCLVSKDPTTVRQITRVGLILWLDHAGGKKKTFGIRFPIAFPMRARAEAPKDSGQAPREGETQPQSDVEILGPGRNDERQIENGPSGVAARYRVTGDLVVYEMKVPLRKSDQAPFAIDVDPGAALRVELQTPEWRGPLPMRRGPAIGIGVGRPGGGVFYPGADMGVLRPLDIAANLRLATGPSR